MSFRLVKYANHVEFHVSRGSPLIHTHSLDECDANKRNSALLKHVQADITKGYAPAAVIGSIRGSGQLEAQARLNAAGGVYLTRQDAINSGATWRKANPNALFALLDTKNDTKIQCQKAFQALNSIKWLSASIQAESQEHVIGWGIVFADPARLQNLT